MLEEIRPATPNQLFAQLSDNVAAFDGENDAELQLFAALRFVESGITSELRPLLALISLHERFVDVDILHAMSLKRGELWTRELIDQLLTALGHAGLLRRVAPTICELHPLLSRYLSHTIAQPDKQWVRAFIRLMAVFADTSVAMPIHQQRGIMEVHGASMLRAVSFANDEEFTPEKAAIIQMLAAYAYNSRDFVRAQHLFTVVADIFRRTGKSEAEATAYHQLGRIAEDQFRLGEAESWFRKSLGIKLTSGSERGRAATYHHLGIIEYERGNYEAAEAFYQQSLAISEGLSDESVKGVTYHQLGMAAEKQRNYAAAEAWYRKAVAVAESTGDHAGAAMTYHQLAGLASELGNFAVALDWFRKSLAIKEALGDAHGAAVTYVSVGTTFQELGDLDSAEASYRKALTMEDQLGELAGVGDASHQLGIIAHLRQDLDVAESWFMKALAIRETFDDTQRLAATFHHLGIIAHEKNDFDVASSWYGRALAIAVELGDEQGIAGVYHQFGNLQYAQHNSTGAEEWYLKSLEINQTCGDEHSAAGNTVQLALVASEVGQWEVAGQRFIASATSYIQLQRQQQFAMVCHRFTQLLKSAPVNIRPDLISQWHAAGLPPIPQRVLASLDQPSIEE